MSNTIIGVTSPIYFPNQQSPFPGATHQDVACDCFGNEFIQKFHCTDRIYFGVQVFSIAINPRVYILDEDKNRISGAINGIFIDANNYYFDIDLTGYCDRKVYIEYAELIFPNETTVDISEPISIVSSLDCIDCSRVLSYDGDCIEWGTKYGDTPGAPLFTQYLRLEGSIDIASDVSSGEYYKDSKGFFEPCGIEVDEAWRLNLTFAPSWMKRKLLYITRSKRFYIDGKRFVPESTLNTGQISGFLSELDILLKPQQGFATITGCN